MDNKILRFYNQNRYLVWTVILTIVGIIVLIQTLNNFIVQKNQTESQYNNTEMTIAEEIKQKESHTVISGKDMKPEVTNVIDTFMYYCNNGKAEEAYNLLSEDCKNILYPTYEGFYKNYYLRIFNEKKTYKAQAYISNSNLYTYRMDFTEDIMATRESIIFKHR